MLSSDLNSHLSFFSDTEFQALRWAGEQLNRLPPLDLSNMHLHFVFCALILNNKYGVIFLLHLHLCKYLEFLTWSDPYYPCHVFRCVLSQSLLNRYKVGIVHLP